MLLSSLQERALELNLYCLPLRSRCKIWRLHTRASHSHCGGSLALPELGIILPECKLCHCFACRDPSCLRTADTQSQDVTLPFASPGKFSLATVMNVPCWCGTGILQNVTKNTAQIQGPIPRSFIQIPFHSCYYNISIALNAKSVSCWKPAPWRLIPAHLDGYFLS